MCVKRFLAVAAGVLTASACLAEAPKNVILFIGDGMSTPQRMTAEEFARKTGRGPLVLNNLPHQATTRTRSASSLVTDSAAAATAIACGAKTYNGGLGVDASGKPVFSSAVAAKETGRKVGIVTSVTINHATPGGFYAHRKNRGEGYGIGLDLIDSGFDYFAGGGLDRHGDAKDPLFRGDIYDLAAKAGYTVVRKDAAAFHALRPGVGKTWYVATSGAMPYAIDREGDADLPTLAELTAKGLELLENEKGFFMMVEGGSIDWAGHANDAATNLRELLALDDAVKVAVQYRETHPDTLVVVTGDHETGGMTMGFAGTGYAFYMERLAKQTRSAGCLSGYIGRHHPASLAEMEPFLTESFGLRFDAEKAKGDPMLVTARERAELESALAHDLKLAREGRKDDEHYDAAKITRFPTAVKNLVSHKSGIGWTSGSHTALPVLTTAVGPGAERFAGFIDNTDISKILKELLAR